MIVLQALLFTLTLAAGTDTNCCGRACTLTDADGAGANTAAAGDSRTCGAACTLTEALAPV
jgi:hypothetical protein